MLMDAVLVIITAISLVLAIVMGFIVFKLVREERARSDARVALLRAASATEPSLTLHEFDDLTENGVPAAIASSTLFANAETAAPWGPRLAVAGAAALTVALTGYALLQWGTGSSNEAASARKPIAPLELVTMQHTQDSDGLTITGSVLNPRDGTATARVSVAAVVFGADGSQVGSGRAPLDYVTLAPGDESGFVVIVPVRGTIARYRVGFRAADGTVVAHVDRRTPGSSARNTGSSGSAPWVH